MISIRTFFSAGLITAAIVLLPVSQTAAQEFSESHLAAARDAAVHSPIAQEFDQVLPMLSQRVQDRLIRLRPDLHQVISETVQGVALKLVARRADLDSAAALVWARTFSEEELKELAVFYTSPVGKKFMEVSAKLGTDTVQAVQNWSNRVGEELLDKSREELKKLGHEL